MGVRKGESNVRPAISIHYDVSIGSTPGLERNLPASGFTTNPGQVLIMSGITGVCEWPYRTPVGMGATYPAKTRCFRLRSKRAVSDDFLWCSLDGIGAPFRYPQR